MRPITPLKADDFYEFFPRYFDSHPVTEDALKFEEALEAEANRILSESWRIGWDFEARSCWFDDRGVSILIENVAIDWRQFWEHLVAQTENLPAAAIINFEVWDFIRGKLKVGGSNVVRRLITSDGIFEEAAG